MSDPDQPGRREAELDEAALEDLDVQGDDAEKVVGGRIECPCTGGE
jgi:hypothetical protein